MAPQYNGAYVTNITTAWLYTEMGENGNYYINNYYYNKTYGVISNGGGNRNSIGIETCILDGVRYSNVMRTTANLVAHLLNVYVLGLNRVLQHRNFSGKTCPMSMIKSKDNSMFTWNSFMSLVESEYFIVKNCPSIKIEYVSNNPDILDNNGNILKYVESDTEVSYTVKATFDGKTVEKTYTTTIHKM